MAKIISITGKFCSGKNTFADELENQLKNVGYSVSRLSFSTVLKETLNIWQLPTSRENLQNLGLVMREIFGGSVVCDYVFKQAHASLSDYVIIDGFRTVDDKAALLKTPDAIQIYIEAPDELRFEWMKKRQEKFGEQYITKEEFDNRSLHPIESVIPEYKDTAKYVYSNNQGLEHLKRYCQQTAEEISKEK